MAYYDRREERRSDTIDFDRALEEMVIKLTEDECRREGIDRRTESDIINTLLDPRNKDKYIHTFTRDRRRCPDPNRIDPDDLYDFMGEIVVDYINRVLDEMAREEEAEERRRRSRYSDDRYGRENSRYRSSRRDLDRGRGRVYEADQTTDIGNVFKQKLRQNETTSSSQDDRRPLYKENKREDYFKQETHEKFQFIGTDNPKSKSEMDQVSFIEAEDDSSISDYNTNIARICIDGIIVVNNQHQVPYKNIDLYIPFGRDSDVINTIKSVIKESVSPAIYMTSINYDKFICAPFGAPGAEEARDLITKVNAQLPYVKSMNDINVKLVNLFNNIKSPYVKLYFETMIFKEFTNKLRLFLFRFDKPHAYVNVGDWASIINLASSNFKYAVAMREHVKDKFANSIFNCLKATLMTVFSPYNGDPIVTAKDEPGIIAACPDIHEYHGKYLPRDYGMIPEENKNHLFEKIDENYLIHKVRRKLIITNIDLTNSSLTDSDCNIILSSEHLIHSCLKCVWGNGESLETECTRMVVYNGNGCNDNQQPTNLFSVGIHDIAGYISVLTPIDI